MECHKCGIAYSTINGWLRCATKKCVMYNKKQTRINLGEEE